MLPPRLYKGEAETESGGHHVLLQLPASLGFGVGVLPPRGGKNRKQGAFLEQRARENRQEPAAASPPSRLLLPGAFFPGRCSEVFCVFFSYRKK